MAAVIREDVATFLADGAKDPRIQGLVTVTAVEVTRDLRHARVFVSVMGTDEQRSSTMEGLASVATHLRARLGRSMHLRVAPMIEFASDPSVAHAARIESLLSQIKDAEAPDRNAGHED